MIIKIYNTYPFITTAALEDTNVHTTGHIHCIKYLHCCHGTQAEMALRVVKALWEKAHLSRDIHEILTEPLTVVFVLTNRNFKLSKLY